MKKSITIFNVIFLVLVNLNYSNAQSLFKDLAPGPHPASSTPDDFMNVGNTMYFVTAVSGTGTSLYNNQLWKSDGTVAGTILLKDNLTTTNIAHPVKLRANVNGTLYFTVFDNPGCSVCAPQLWKTDGTVVGTVMVTTLDYTSFFGGGSGTEPTNFAAAGDKLIFVFNNENNDYELWTSDGTAAGTSELMDLYTGGSGVNTDAPLISYNGKVYFSGTSTSYSDYELFVTDGTIVGTTIVKDISPVNQFGMNFGSEPSGWFLFNNSLYFTASDGTNDGLWKTDGTEAGTVVVKSPISGFSAPIIFKNELYFGGSNYSLWKTDGTDAGTVMIKDLVGNPRGANNDFIFTHYTTSLTVPPYYENQLWKSDGTTAGTTEVSYDMGMTSSNNVIGNNMYITRTDSGSVTEVGIWVTDGTEAGTSKVLAGFGTGNVHVFNNMLFFANYESATGYELWSLSDGGSVNNLAEQTSIESVLYPNPTNGLIYIKNSELKNNRVTVTNMTGKVLLEEENTNQVDLSSFTKGVYFITVKQGMNVVTQKVVLQD